jgi:hypothetical protein
MDVMHNGTGLVSTIVRKRAALVDFDVQAGVRARELVGPLSDADFEFVAHAGERFLRLLPNSHLAREAVVLRTECLVHGTQREVGANARQHFGNLERFGDVVDATR